MNFFACTHCTTPTIHTHVLLGVEPRDDDDEENTQINQNPTLYADGTNKRAHKNSSRHYVVDVVGTMRTPSAVFYPAKIPSSSSFTSRVLTQEPESALRSAPSQSHTLTFANVPTSSAEHLKQIMGSTRWDV